jgi:hypothetical protein
VTDESNNPGENGVPGSILDIISTYGKACERYGAEHRLDASILDEAWDAVVEAVGSEFGQWEEANTVAANDVHDLETLAGELLLSLALLCEFLSVGDQKVVTKVDEVVNLVGAQFREELLPIAETGLTRKVSRNNPSMIRRMLESPPPGPVLLKLSQMMGLPEEATLRELARAMASKDVSLLDPGEVKP